MTDETRTTLLKIVQWCGENFERDAAAGPLFNKSARPVIDGTALLDEICSMGISADEIDAALQLGQDAREQREERMTR